MDAEELLARPGARLLCVSASGAESLPTPDSLATWHDATLSSVGLPLELFDVGSQPNVVAAFLACIAEGHAETMGALADGSGVHDVYVFDRRAIDDCVAFVLTPSEAEAPAVVKTDLQLPQRVVRTRMDMAGRTTWVDDGYEQLLGYSRDEVVGHSSATTVHPDDMERVVLSFAELLQRPGGETRIRMRLRHKDGDYRWFETTRTNLLHTQEASIVSESLDITSEMHMHTALAAREALLAQLTEALPLGLVFLSDVDTVDLANARWLEMTGTEASGGLDSLVQAAFREPDVALGVLRRAIESGEEVSVVAEFTSPERGARQGRLRLQLVTSAPGSAEVTNGILLTLDDVTDSLDSQNELQRLAETDHLTQALNRRGLERAFEALAGNAHSGGAPVQVIYFDLDGFKQINDDHGHAAGDLVLQQVCQSIRSTLRPSDIVGRLGGDEFVAVLPGVPGSQVELIIERVQKALAADVEIGTSVGSANAEPGDTFEAVVKRADEAMYRAKAQRTS